MIPQVYIVTIRTVAGEPVRLAFSAPPTINDIKVAFDRYKGDQRSQKMAGVIRMETVDFMDNKIG